MAGSRAGVVVAACWATFMYFGRARYVEMTRKIIETTGFIERECSLVPGLRVQGCCDVSVVALASDVFNIYRLSDAMAGRGWSLNALQRPPSFHVAVTYPLTADGVPQKFVSDIAELTEEILLTPMQDTGSHAAMYGMSAGVPDRSLVSELAWCFLDGTYTTADVAENCDVMGSKSDGDVTENGSGEGRKMTHGDFGGRKDKVDYEQTNNKANILNGTARTNGLN